MPREGLRGGIGTRQTRLVRFRWIRSEVGAIAHSLRGRKKTGRFASFSHNS